MLREGIRLSRRHRRWLYGTLAALFASGVLWLGFHHFARVESEIGETAHPLEPLWLRVHGAAAMLFLGVLGSLVRGHVRMGWRVGLNRLSGAALVSANAVLVLSGWALYYVGSESRRPWISVAHWTIGVALPLVLAVHVWRGRSLRRRRGLSAPQGDRHGTDQRPWCATISGAVK